MFENYLSLQDEIEELTEYDGFLRACLRLRDDMLFYDRDVLLAIFSGNLESLVVSALFWAALKGNQEAEDLSRWILERIEDLPKLLWEEDAPFDVQALLERFLDTSGQALRRRFPVIAAVFKAYLNGDYNLEVDPDAYLVSARAVKQQELDLNVLGTLGALALRGKFFRRGWLMVIPPPSQEGLQTIISLVEGVASLPGAGFPLREAAAERNRVSAAPLGLIHLDEFRRRKGYLGNGSGVWRGPDEVDRLLATVFSSDNLDDQEAESLLRQRQELVPLLLNVLAAPEFLDEDAPGAGTAPVNAAHLLTKAKSGEAVDGFINLLQHADPFSPAYQAAMEGLEAVAAQAGMRIAAHLEGEGDMNVAVPLASVLGKTSRNDQVFRALTGLFSRVAWEEDREAVAAALADYGDPRAIPILEEALRRRNIYGKGTIREAISRLREKGAKRHSNELKRPTSRKNGYTGEK